MTKEDPLYLYGFMLSAHAPTSFENTGVGATPVAPLVQGTLAAITSIYPFDAAKNVVTSRANMVAHQKVLEESMEQGVLLPIQFGTVSANATTLIKLMKTKAGVICESLDQINGKVELGLKAFWKDMSKVYADIAENHPDVVRKKSKLGKNPSQDKLIEIGQMVEQALLEKKDEMAAQLLASLTGIAEDHTTGKLLNEKMCLNASFLVAKQQEPKFDEAVNQLDKKFGQLLMFKYVGPLPVYNFISLDLTEAATDI